MSEPFEDPFDRPPDVWRKDGVDREALYWYIDGVWHWRIVVRRQRPDDAYVVLAEGVGPP